MLIDFHTHTFPERIAAYALSKMQAAGGLRAYTDGTEACIRASMHRAGVDWSVVLPVATNPTKVHSMNDGFFERSGRDGLLYFGCIHPDMPGWSAELERIAQAGLRGVKIHPEYQDTDIDDIRYLRILERAGELDLTVVMHAGDDIGFPGMVRSSPSMIRNALRQLGPVRFVAAHMGGWKCWGPEVDALAETGVWLDSSFSLGEITPLEGLDWPEEKRRLLREEEFCAMVRLFGSERILFGTDSPWTDQKQSVEQLLALPLTEEEKQNILWKNAQKLLFGT